MTPSGDRPSLRFLAASAVAGCPGYSTLLDSPDGGRSWTRTSDLSLIRRTLLPTELHAPDGPRPGSCLVGSWTFLAVRSATTGAVLSKVPFLNLQP